MLFSAHLPVKADLQAKQNRLFSSRERLFSSDRNQADTRQAEPEQKELRHFPLINSCISGLFNWPSTTYRVRQAVSFVKHCSSSKLVTKKYAGSGLRVRMVSFRTSSRTSAASFPLSIPVTVTSNECGQSSRGTRTVRSRDVALTSISRSVSPSERAHNA